MHVSPYIHYNGNCGEAIDFYVRAIGATVDMRSTFAGSPAEAQTPPDWRDKILHARIGVGPTQILMGDAPPGRYAPGQGYSVSLMAGSADEAERCFKALCEGGTVIMPMAETFFALRFGMLVDKFAVPWMVLCTPGAQ
jgi:PhnB protein